MVGQGVAEISISPGSVNHITRVTVDVDGTNHDLVLDESTNKFEGQLFLSPGTKMVTARAFDDDTVVAASNLAMVEIQPGIVIHVSLRLIELTTDQPFFGPIFDSFTFPTAVQEGESATFAVSIIAPDDDPISYLWSSDCADATFSAVDVATTMWIKPSTGTCQISLVATSHGISTSASFSVVVFPVGELDGRLDVEAKIVIKPFMFLSLPSLGCVVFNGTDSSCSSSITFPSTSQISAGVSDWGNSTPGTVTLTDDCGGELLVANSGSVIVGTWRPPASGGLCLLTGRAVNGDGGVATVTAAVLAHSP